MQRQQQPRFTENKTNRQSRWVTVSKLGIGFLILFYGILNLFMLAPILKTGENHYFEDYITAAALILQSVFSFFGGISLLLRHRKIARFCLYSVSFSLVVLGIAMALSQRHAGSPAQIPLMLGISLAIFIVGATSFFLGRWLTSQDEE